VVSPGSKEVAVIKANQSGSAADTKPDIKEDWN